MEDNNSYMHLKAEEIFEKLGAAPLSTKKNILTYIDTIKKMSKSDLEEEQVRESYEYIDKKIDEMAQSVKVNTLVYLKNELRNKLGKYAVVQQAEEGSFLRFYKETFKNQVKTKEYTWAMLDISKIQETSILETLKTINTYALKNKLTKEEKEDIYPMIKRLVDTHSLKLINQLRSMEGIRKAFKIKIIEKDKRFSILQL